MKFSNIASDFIADNRKPKAIKNTLHHQSWSFNISIHSVCVIFSRIHTRKSFLKPQWALNTYDWGISMLNDISTTPYFIFYFFHRCFGYWKFGIQSFWLFWTVIAIEQDRLYERGRLCCWYPLGLTRAGCMCDSIIALNHNLDFRQSGWFSVTISTENNWIHAPHIDFLLLKLCQSHPVPEKWLSQIRRLAGISCGELLDQQLLKLGHILNKFSWYLH